MIIVFEETEKQQLLEEFHILAPLEKRRKKTLKLYTYQL